MKIKTLEAVYTGGNIWIFWGTLEDGNYFLTSDEGWTVILKDSPENFDESLYEDWQDEHKVKDLEDEELKTFLTELLEAIKEKDFLTDSEIDWYRNCWELGQAAEEDPEPEEPKQVKIKEFLELYNAELQKMFDGDESNHIYGYDITLEWNGYKVNLGDGAIPTNALIPALEEMDSEYEGEM